LRQHWASSAADDEEAGATAAARDEEELEEVAVTDERDKSLSERILYWNNEGQEELEKQVEKDVGTKLNGVDKQEAVLENTRLAMTSRTAFFNGEPRFSRLSPDHVNLCPSRSL
jgi:hypothetical protein